MFEKITPEQAGVSSAAIAKFIEMLNRRSIPMHSLLMMKGDKLFCEYYWAPFTKDTVHRMYSQTKSYTSVAIGLLEEEGKLSLDDTIVSHFPEKIDTPPAENLKKQTIREMLTMTTIGECDNWFLRTDEVDRTHLYLNRTRNSGRSAGTIWEYDSAGSQVLSSLVEKLSGKSTFDYLNEKIFRHLGTFKTATMLKTRNGDTWGDSALICTPRDMMSFGRFVMNYGTWEGKRLMNENYLRTATSPISDNTECGPYVFRHGYGYQIWHTERDGFAFDGMGSQYTICLPDLDVIMVCTADTQGIAHNDDIILGGYFDTVIAEMKNEPIAPCPEAEAVLANETKDLKLFCAKGAEDSPFRAELDGAVWECNSNPMGITSFSFCFDPDGKSGVLNYTNAQGNKQLPFAVNANRFGKFPQLGYSGDFGGLRTTDGSMYDDAVSFAWLRDNKIRIKLQIIDRYLGNGDWIFAFKDGSATVRMTKTAEDFLNEYNGYLVATKVK